jgi:thymidylate kinase
MQTDRSIFIQALFCFLSEVEYLWLKALPAKPEDTPEQSDIDLLVKENEVPGLLFFICKQTAVTHCEATEKNSVTYLQLQFQDGSQLRLDLLTSLVRKQFNYLPNGYLFENRVWKNGVATYPSQVLLEHVLLFNFLNQAGLPAKYVQYFGAMPAHVQQQLISFANSKYGTGFISFQQMSVFSKKGRQQFVAYLKRQPENSFPARSERFFRYLTSHFWNKKIRTPRVITFSGVDGAGKSTLLADLKSVLTEKLGKRVVTLRHRPSLLPILSAFNHGKQAAEARAAANLPRQGKNGSTVSSLLRFSYYYTDFLFGQVYIWLRYLLPGYTVIYDRYYFDFIVDGKRSNLSLGEELPKRLYRFLYKPDLNIFLYADADTIRQRKQELPRADIEQMTGRYLALFEELKTQGSSQYLCIENQDRQVSLDTILHQYFLGKNESNPICHVPKIVNRKSQIVNPPAVLDPC